MKKLIYKILFSFAWIIGRLPDWILFGLGDILYLLFYYVVGYRRGVVRMNLTNSFPEKTKNEIIKIERKFYRQLADIFIESIALVSMSKKRLAEKMVFEGVDTLQGMLKERGVISAMGHFGTWEYTIGFRSLVGSPVLAVYHKLSNEIAEMFFYDMRSRFGAEPVTMERASREIIKKIREKRYPAVALIADQTPLRDNIRRWIPFLNQPTGFYEGPERLASTLKMGVVFAYITKVKRGYYKCEFQTIYDGVTALEEGEITLRYAKKLEAMILEHPHLWMWSHKRWKHKPLS